MLVAELCACFNLVQKSLGEQGTIHSTNFGQSFCIDQNELLLKYGVGIGMMSLAMEYFGTKQEP